VRIDLVASIILRSRRLSLWSAEVLPNQQSTNSILADAIFDQSRRCEVYDVMASMQLHKAKRFSFYSNPSIENLIAYLFSRSIERPDPRTIAQIRTSASLTKTFHIPRG
jgi:hypothetical protein